jgi:hypothetical protein
VRTKFHTPSYHKSFNKLEEIPKKKNKKEEYAVCGFRVTGFSEEVYHDEKDVILDKQVNLLDRGDRFHERGKNKRLRRLRVKTGQVSFKRVAW